MSPTSGTRRGHFPNVSLSVCAYKITSMHIQCAHRSIQTLCVCAFHTHSGPRGHLYCIYVVSHSFLISHSHWHSPLPGSPQPWIYFLLLSWQELSFIRRMESLTRMGNGNNKRMQQYKVMSKNLYKKNG